MKFLTYFHVPMCQVFPKVYPKNGIAESLSMCIFNLNRCSIIFQNDSNNLHFHQQ